MSDIDVRVLAGVSLAEVHRAWVRAFSDYQVQIQLSQEDLGRMFKQNSVEFEASIGAYDGSEMIGFWINGLRYIDDCKIAYDSGTALCPEYRGKGLSKLLAKESYKVLRRLKVSHYLLEVIVGNDKAYNLYLKDGFEVIRRFKCFKRASFKSGGSGDVNGIVFEEGLFNPLLIQSLPKTEYEPSWQNSVASMTNIKESIHSVVAKWADKIIGYGLIQPGRGRISQIGIDPRYWDSALPAVILNRLCAASKTEEIAVINVEDGAANTSNLFLSHGFELFIEQYEMRKSLEGYL